MKRKDLILNGISCFIIIAFAVLFLYFGRISYIWYDESFTMNMVNHSVGEMISLTAMDVHPPLYYMVVKAFVTLLGQRTVALHLPSILFMVAILIETLFFMNRYADSTRALITIIGFICMPQIAKYTLELRMYSMCMFLIASSVFLMFSIIKDFDKKKGIFFSYKWILFILLQTACAYTHYFAGVAAVGSSLVFLIILTVRFKQYKKTLILWSLGCIAMFILYLPWISVLFKQMHSVNEDYWIGAPSFAELITYTDEIFKTDSPVLTVILVLFFLAGILLFFLSLKKNELAPWICLCYGTVLFWLLFGFGYSILVSPIIVSRYLVMLFPILWLPTIFTVIKDAKIPVCAGVIIYFFILGYSVSTPVLDNYRNSEQMYLRAYLEEHLDKENDAFFSFYMQDMSIQAAYFPDVPQYLLSGRDEGEAFKNWPLLVNCRFINDFNELHESKGSIWCQDGMFPQAFIDAGYSLEEIPVGKGILYRYYPE